MIELLLVDKQEHVAILIISSNSKMIIYAPCDLKAFSKSEKYQDADILIIGNTIAGDILKDGFILNENHLLRKELLSMKLIQYENSMESNSYYYTLIGRLEKIL